MKIEIHGRMGWSFLITLAVLVTLVVAATINVDVKQTTYDKYSEAATAAGQPVGTHVGGILDNLVEKSELDAAGNRLFEACINMMDIRDVAKITKAADCLETELGNK